MKIILEYRRRPKPRGGYPYPLEYSLYSEGNSRGWAALITVYRPWMRVSPAFDLSGTRYHPGGSVALEENIDLQGRPSGLALRLHLPAKRVPVLRCFDCKADRETFIAALHQLVEQAREAWAAFWRDNPPDAGSPLQRLTIGLPEPEELWTLAPTRRYDW
ncbi:hypothetical protein [Nitrospira calida]|jgi:hypothetical protein